MLQKFNSPVLVISLLLLLAIILKFLWLDKFPVGMSNDELEYILSSKTYSLYGKDLSGFTFPTSLFFNRTEGVISAIPPIIISPFYSLFPLNQFTARLPYVIVNLLTAYSIFLLTSILLRNKIISMLSALLFLVSPWGMFLSRNTVDSSFSLLFYTFAIVGFLKFNGKMLILPLTSLLLGFLSYHGAKPIMLPLFLICLGYRLWINESNKINIKQAILSFITVFIILISYSLINYFQPNSILSNKSLDLFLVDANTVTTIVDDLRRTTIENPFKDLMFNKITVSFQMLINRYLQAFSTDILFVSGDPRATYKFGEHGLLYYFDLILIILGAARLYKYHKSALIFLTLILLIAPIPTALNKIEISVINRAMMLLPVLIIFSSVGAYQLFLIMSKRLGDNLTFALMGLVFLLFVINFHSIYFFTLPIKGQETYLFSERVLTKYLKMDQNQKTVVITEKPRSAYFRAIFYSDKETQAEFLNNAYPAPDQPSYKLDNIEYTSTCPTQLLPNVRYVLSRKVDKCLEGIPFNLSIIDQKDAGDIFKIYNSTTCLDQSNERWRRFHNLNDYNIERLDDNQFCQKWIAKTVIDEKIIDSSSE